MFDEPIRIGLIRFADLYDHHWQAAERIGGDGARPTIGKEAIEFDLSHQPALVIYTASSSAASDRVEASAPAADYDADLGRNG